MKKSRSAGETVSDLTRMREVEVEVEAENARLKRIYADLPFSRIRTLSRH